MSSWKLWLCVLYVLSPLDFIPDVIPFLGWIDDLAVIGYAISQYQKDEPLTAA